VLLACWLTPPPALAAGEQREWFFASIAPEGSPAGNFVEAASNLIARSSGGKIRVKRRMGGVLGDEQDTALECQHGKIQVFAGSLGAVASLVPELRFLEQPYLFPDVATFQRVMKGLGNGRRPEVQALFNRRGLVILGMAAIGWRNISSVRKAIHTPSDLQGLRLRSQPAELHLEMWKAFGAVPKSLALTELNSGLEIQVVEAFDVPATFVYATSLDARIKYYTLSRHILQIGLIVVNKAAWDALPTAWRTRIFDGMQEVTLRGEREISKLDEDLIAMLPRRGVSVIQPTDEELGAFRAAAAKLEGYVRRTGSREELALFDRVRALIDGKGWKAAR
jgi:TRAP-type C4-dicarboxylate transport system substrate-binding protein